MRQTEIRAVFEIILYFALVACITFLIIHFVGQRTVVNGVSMQPTLSDGDYLIVDKLSYRFHDPDRFDIIVFPQEDGRYFIKRIIGLPGENVRIDEDGFIYLVDRKKDVIISGGENIYPVQIEDFLRAHPAIKDVAVIGMPDQRLGEITAAIIEVKEGFACSEEEIRDYCMKLPRYKRPVKIIFADIPRNPTGKIEKPKLRQMYSVEQLVARENEG